jgi:serine phosphatase RsbU (regulator of sigma subunit)
MSDELESASGPAAPSGPPGLRLPLWTKPPRFDLVGVLSWPFLSHMSPARRATLVAVAVFEIWEAYRLWQMGLLDRNWVALALGFLVLLLLSGYELAEHAALRRDSDLGREIIQWLLPSAPPRVPGYRLAFHSRRADAVGCDYFNAYRHAITGRDHLFLIMADVAGNGMQAALLMATFQASLRALLDSHLPLDELAAQMNRWSWNRGIDGKHFTMAFFADLDLEDGMMNYVSAGHQPPVLCRSGGRLEHLDRGGFPLGALADSGYEVGSARLESGDALVIFTDGLVEAMDRRGEKYGEDRVLHDLRLLRDATAEDILARLCSSVLAFIGLTRQPDDISFLIMTRNTVPPAP